MFKPLVDIRARIYDMQHDPATRRADLRIDDGEDYAVGLKLPYTPGRLVGQARARRTRSSTTSAAS